MLRTSHLILIIESKIQKLRG